jgi:pre-mRNA-splicing factor 38A
MCTPVSQSPSHTVILIISSPAGFSLTYTDEFIDNLLHEERACDIILSRLPKREVLEETENLPPRKSALMDATEDSRVPPAGVVVVAEDRGQSPVLVGVEAKLQVGAGAKVRASFTLIGTICRRRWRPIHLKESPRSRSASPVRMDTTA